MRRTVHDGYTHGVYRRVNSSGWGRSRPADIAVSRRVRQHRGVRTTSLAVGYPSLVEMVGRGGVVVLSGAGLSTESGIPDYRGPTGARRPSSPMTFQAFTRDPAARRRYRAPSRPGS